MRALTRAIAKNSAASGSISGEWAGVIIYVYLTMDSDDFFLQIQSAHANAIADIELGKNLLKHFIDIESFAVAYKIRISHGLANNENVTAHRSLVISLIELLNGIIFKITAFGEEELPTHERGMITDLTMATEDGITGLNKNYHSATLDYDIDSIKRKLDSNVFESDKIRELAQVHCDNLLRLKNTFYV